MRTTISARHCDISEELRDRAQQAVERLSALLTRPVDAAVVFDQAPQGALAEIRIHGGRGEVFVATGEDKDHRSALDRVIDKIRRQVEKDGVDARRGRPNRETA